jgi:hypothetical protein
MRTTAWWIWLGISFNSFRKSPVGSARPVERAFSRWAKFSIESVTGMGKMEIFNFCKISPR